MAASSPDDPNPQVVSNFESRSVTMDNPIDSVFQLITSDVGSIAFGIIALLVLVVGRLVLDGADNENMDLAVQTRSNLLAVLSIGALILNGLTKLDVESVIADPVILQGKVLDTPKIVPLECSSSSITWVSNLRNGLIFRVTLCLQISLSVLKDANSPWLYI